MYQETYREIGRLLSKDYRKMSLAAKIEILENTGFERKGKAKVNRFANGYENIWYVYEKPMANGVSDLMHMDQNGNLLYRKEMFMDRNDESLEKVVEEYDEFDSRKEDIKDKGYFAYVRDRIENVNENYERPLTRLTKGLFELLFSPITWIFHLIKNDHRRLKIEDERRSYLIKSKIKTNKNAWHSSFT